jgi:hypothetical protein
LPSPVRRKPGKYSMSASDIGDKPLMLLVRLIQMGTQAEYRKDAGGAAWENALKIAGVPPRM